MFARFHCFHGKFLLFVHFSFIHLFSYLHFAFYPQFSHFNTTFLFLLVHLWHSSKITEPVWWRLTVTSRSRLIFQSSIITFSPLIHVYSFNLHLSLSFYFYHSRNYIFLFFFFNELISELIDNSRLKNVIYYHCFYTCYICSSFSFCTFICFGKVIILHGMYYLFLSHGVYFCLYFHVCFLSIFLPLINSTFAFLFRCCFLRYYSLLCFPFFSTSVFVYTTCFGVNFYP